MRRCRKQRPMRSQKCPLSGNLRWLQDWRAPVSMRVDPRRAGDRSQARSRVRSLFFSRDIRAVRLLPADREILRQVSDDTRLMVSEPVGDLPGAWVEMPEASYGMVSKGGRPAPAVLPGAPAESPVRIRERGAPGDGSDAVLNHTGSRFSRLDPEPVAAGVEKGFHAVGLATRRLTASGHCRGAVGRRPDSAPDLGVAGLPPRELYPGGLVRQPGRALGPGGGRGRPGHGPGVAAVHGRLAARL
jgi:hypothetical protein